METSRSFAHWPRALIRALLRLTEYAALRFANRRSKDRLPSGVDNLLKARVLSRSCADVDSILDVGCGNGGRLEEMSLFVGEEVRLCGVDVAKRPPPGLPGARIPDLIAFDGESLPFETNTFDVSCVCYVLHHLAPEHAFRLMREVRRVTRKRILVLEDSMPEWSGAYRVRNWAHLREANILYNEESEDFAPFFGTQGFLTHTEWREQLEEMPGVMRVHVNCLDGIKRYEHHTLFQVELGVALA